MSLKVFIFSTKVQQIQIINYYLPITSLFPKKYFYLFTIGPIYRKQNMLKIVSLKVNKRITISQN